MIVAMPEYNLRGCSDFTHDLFPEQLVDDVVTTVQTRFRTEPGADDRALAGLSGGAGCVINTLFKEPREFAYYGAFSPNWPSTASADLVKNHHALLTNPAIDRDVKLFWITKGGPEDIVTQQVPAYFALFHRCHVHYTYVDGPRYGAIAGHVWDTWRRALHEFAPMLFRS